MDSDLFTCQTCQTPYDLDDHLPRTIPSCGHSFCTECLQTLISTIGKAICPADNHPFSVPSNVNQFPVNFSLKQVIEKRLSTVFCPLHNEEATLVCMTDHCRICSRCEHSAAHMGHPVRHFQKVIEDSRERQEQLKIVLANSEKYQKNIEDSLEKHAEGLRRVLTFSLWHVPYMGWNALKLQLRLFCLSNGP